MCALLAILHADANPSSFLATFVQLKKNSPLKVVNLENNFAQIFSLGNNLGKDKYFFIAIYI
jgi:hypothetical protein